MDAEKQLSKRSIYELQKIDANCNECIHLKRDAGKTTKYSIKSGLCLKLEKRVTFIQNCCQLETQHCFEHRLDSLSGDERDKRLEE